MRFSQGLTQGRGTRCHPPHCWQATHQGGKPLTSAAGSTKRFIGRPDWLGTLKFFSFSMSLWKTKASGICTSYSVLQASLWAGRRESCNTKWWSGGTGQVSRPRCRGMYQTQLLPISSYCFYILNKCETWALNPSNQCTEFFLA